MAIKINAAQRLKAAIGGQPLSDSFGRQQIRRYSQFLQNPKRKRKDLGTKEGLTMSVLLDGPDQVITISDEDQNVAAYGKLEESPFSNRWRMYNLYVDKPWRGRKLANIIHLGAVHTNKRLESDTTMSAGALSAFKSLERHGYKLKLLDTNADKTVPFKWGTNGVPMVNGKSIEDAENYALYV